MALVGNAPKVKPGGIDVEHYYHNLVGGSMKSYHPGWTWISLSFIIFLNKMIKKKMYIVF